MPKRPNPQEINTNPAVWRNRDALPIIVAGSTNNYGVRAAYSQYAAPNAWPLTGVDVYAASSSIRGDDPNQGYAVTSGTSMGNHYSYSLRINLH